MEPVWSLISYFYQPNLVSPDVRYYIDSIEASNTSAIFSELEN